MKKNKDIKIKYIYRDYLHNQIIFYFLVASILILGFGLPIFWAVNFQVAPQPLSDRPSMQEKSVVQPQSVSASSIPIVPVEIINPVNLLVSSTTATSSPTIIATSTPTNPVISSPTNPVISTPIPLITNIPKNNLKYNVFGDGFSSSYYLDMAKTNFRYDQIATALSFKPLYVKRDDGACSQEYCGFSEKAKMDSGANVVNQTYCLTKNSQACLAWDGQKLKYGNQEIKDFSVYFSQLKIEKVSIYPLADYWLIGVVWTENGQEVGRAWRFDGKNLAALDPENKVPFNTRKGYSGSRIVFGGDEENFIALYAGYDFIGYQVRNKDIWNISDFFSLRLADRGFIPEIIKHQQGPETVWYICSLTTGKPKLIKLWQNGSSVIRGAISLGEDIFAGDYSSALCREGSSGDLEIAVAKKNDGGIIYNHWLLTDKGFDQSFNYQAVSINLSSAQGKMSLANFSGLSLCGADACGQNALDNNLKFTISNNSLDWQTVNFGREYFFSSSGSSLLWRLQASPDSHKIYYSPWFNAVNSVYYAWTEK